MSSATARVIILQEIERITMDEGERWGYAHVRRVLALAQQIDAGLTYDVKAFAYAVTYMIGAPLHAGARQE